MLELKNMQLTENDFNLIFDGLEAIPEKGIAGQMIGDLMIGLFEDKITPDGASKLKHEHDMRAAKRQKEIDAKKEDIAVLKGKLVMLKRYLQTTGALKTVDDIVNPQTE